MANNKHAASTADETHEQSWRVRALALCMASHERLGSACPASLRTVASSRDLVCSIMWHVFPTQGAPLVVKVQHICDKLNIDAAAMPLLEVVTQATKRLKLNLNDTPLVLKVNCCLDVLLDRTSGAKPPSTPDLLELKTDIYAEMIAKSERAWSAMQEWRAKQNAADASHHATAATAAAPAAAARPQVQVVTSRGNAESIRKWLQAHSVSYPDGASLAELEALKAEEEAAIAEEESAMAEYNASMSARGQPSVVSAVSTSGASRTVLDEARAGEEVARRELMEAAREADALAAMPVAVGSAITWSDEPPSSSLPAAAGGGRDVPMVVVGEAVAIVDDNEKRPKGGVAALMNTLRIS